MRKILSMHHPGDYLGPCFAGVQLGGEALRSLSIMDDPVTAARGITGKLEGGNGDFRASDGSSLVTLPATCDGDKTSRNLLTGFLGCCCPQARKPRPWDLFLRNGHIFTGDSANAWAEALSIQGDHVLGLRGGPRYFDDTADKHTRVIDPRGPHGDARRQRCARSRGRRGTEATVGRPEAAATRRSATHRVDRSGAGGGDRARRGWIGAIVGVPVIRYPQQCERHRRSGSGSSGDPQRMVGAWGHSHHVRIGL